MTRLNVKTKNMKVEQEVKKAKFSLRKKTEVLPPKANGIHFSSDVTRIQIEDSYFHCIYEGRIYNLLLLKQALVTTELITESATDCEVLSALYHLHGAEFVQKINGMFAIIIYDFQENVVVAARDKFGIKPLFYHHSHDELQLASVLTDLMPPAQQRESELNHDALSHYFTFQYAPEPATVFKNIHHLPAGHYLVYGPDSKVKIKPYGEFLKIEGSSVAKASLSDVKDAIITSVYDHLEADVAIGTFLSGGIDSTIIASIAKEINPDIKAFTVGYDFAPQCEINDAKTTADVLGIDLYTRKITAMDYWEAARKTVVQLGSPLADPSAIMFSLLSEFASQEVEGCLSGEGADELFGGYPIYKEVDGLRIFTKVPDKLKARLLQVAAVVPPGVRGKNFIERGCVALHERYAGNAFIFTDSEKNEFLKFKGSPWQSVTEEINSLITNLPDLEKMQTIDLHTWLKGDILLKADRLSMAHNLEVRTPFLDDRVLKVAQGLAKSEKIAGNTAKVILRQAFSDYLPPHMKMMTKRGFPVPLAHWLRNELYPEVLTVLTSEVAADFIDQEYSLKLLEEHRQGKDYSRKIWTIVCFILWLEMHLYG